MWTSLLLVCCGTSICPAAARADSSGPAAQIQTKIRNQPLASTPTPAHTGTNSTANPKNHWAYQTIRPFTPPKVKAKRWPRGDIDLFILARLEERKLPPAQDADLGILCRRLYQDLIGLPPTVEERDAFVRNASVHRQEAIASLVDHLLASPRFGEHWGRHWLDVVRFGESVTLRGFIFKEAWRYRDYVIEAFNRDHPFDRLIQEQIAGDLLPYQTVEEHRRQIIATTFLGLGNWNLEEQDKLQLDMDVVDEQLDTLGKAFLGQTLGCARCHDHKFDPIPTRDYYAMAGILRSCQTLKHANVSEWIELPLPMEPEQEERLTKHEREMSSLRQEVEALKASLKAKKGTEGAAAADTVQLTPIDIPAQRAAPQPGAATSEAVQERIKSLESRLKKQAETGPKRPMSMGVKESDKPGDIPVHLRGSVHTLGDMVPRGFLSAIPGNGSPALPEHESGRRQLAAWIASPRNPLTARVMVNRVWLWLMGSGLVGTPDNFGTTGDLPSHPELLDHLATRFVDGGWSIKALVRDIVLSRTYQLSSVAGSRATAVDPENRLLSHGNRRRLTAEQIRDALLAIGGRLQFNTQGPTYPLNRTADFGFVMEDPIRSVYVPVFRNALPEIFDAFDFAPSSMVTGRRHVSTAPTQALFLLNHPFVREQAEAAARRVIALPAMDAAARVDDAYRRSLGRAPTPRERALALRHLPGGTPGMSEQAWTELFHALFASADFRYLD